MNDNVSYWFDENKEEIFQSVERVVRKISKEYRKNRVNHEKFVKVAAWPGYLEIRTQEIEMFGAWEDREDLFEYSFDGQEEIQSLYEVIDWIAEDFREFGYDVEVDESMPNVPVAIIYI